MVKKQTEEEKAHNKAAKSAKKKRWETRHIERVECERQLYEEEGIPQLDAQLKVLGVEYNEKDRLFQDDFILARKELLELQQAQNDRRVELDKARRAVVLQERRLNEEKAVKVRLISRRLDAKFPDLQGDALYVVGCWKEPTEVPSE